MTSLPIRLSTNIITFIAELDLHRIMSGFHGAFATGVASQQGTLTLPDTWFRPPFWDLLMLQLLRPNSSNLPCLYSTFHLEYPLVLSRFSFSLNLDPLLGRIGPKVNTNVRGQEYFIPTKFGKYPSSDSVVKADYVFQYIYIQ